MNKDDDNHLPKRTAENHPEMFVAQLRMLLQMEPNVLRELPEGRERDEFLNRVQEALGDGLGRTGPAGAASPGTEAAPLGEPSSAGSGPWRPSAEDWADGGSTTLDLQFERELERLLAGNPTSDDLLSRLELDPAPSSEAASFEAGPPGPGLLGSDGWSTGGSPESLRPMPGNHVRDWPSIYALALIGEFVGIDGDGISEHAFTHNFAVLMEALYSTVHSGGSRADYKQVLSPWAMLPKPKDLVAAGLMSSKSFESRVTKQLEKRRMRDPLIDRDEVIGEMLHQMKDLYRKRFISLAIGRSNSVAGAPLFTWRLVEARRVGRDATLTPSPAGRHLLESMKGFGPSMPHSEQQATAFLGCLKASPEAVGDLSGLLLSLWSIQTGEHADGRQWRADSAALFEEFFPPQYFSKSNRVGSAGEMRQPSSRKTAGRGITHPRGNILFHAYTARCREWGLIELGDRFDQSGPPALTDLGASVLEELNDLPVRADDGDPTRFVTLAEAAAERASAETVPDA